MDRKIFSYLREVDQLIDGNYVPPVSCEIDLSNKCQNKCSFCVYSDYLSEDKTVMPLETAKDIIHGLQTIGTKSITFTGGGEPLTHTNFNYISTIADTSNIKLGLITNGINLVKYPEAFENYTFVRISLDAASDETWFKLKGNHLFTNVIDGIKKLVELKNPAVGISFILCKENLHEMGEIKKVAKILDVNYLQMKPDVNGNLSIGYDSEAVMTKRFLANKKDAKIACAIAGLVGIISANSDVYYCCMHRGNPDFCIGNLKEDSFPTIWKNRVKFKPDTSQCTTCRYMNYANGYKAVQDRRKYSFLRHKEFL